MEVMKPGHRSSLEGGGGRGREGDGRGREGDGRGREGDGRNYELDKRRCSTHYSGKKDVSQTTYYRYILSVSPR